jgi:predicted DNA-binding protein
MMNRTAQDKQRVVATLPCELVERMDKLADKRGMSRSALVDWILSTWIEDAEWVTRASEIIAEADDRLAAASAITSWEINEDETAFVDKDYRRAAREYADAKALIRDGKPFRLRARLKDVNAADDAPLLHIAWKMDVEGEEETIVRIFTMVDGIEFGPTEEEKEGNAKRFY